jgi:hypothetical protein
MAGDSVAAVLSKLMKNARSITLPPQFAVQMIIRLRG